MTHAEKEAAVIAAVPETGTITHNALVDALITGGKGEAVNAIFAIVAQKKLVPEVNVDLEAHVSTLTYSRPTV